MTDINNDYLKSARLRWLCSSCDVSLHWQNNSLQNKFKIFYTGNKTYADAIKTTNVTVLGQFNDTSNVSSNSSSFHGFSTFAVPNVDNTNPATTAPSPSIVTSTPNPPAVNNPPMVSNPLVVNNPPPPPANDIQSNFKDVKKFPNMNKDKICTFLTNGKCRFGAKGENQLGKCDKYHPNQCRTYNLNGLTENGCKKGLKCSEWHATYICRSSANSKICSRPECPFKHHKNCTVSNEHFLNNANHIPRQYLGPNIPTFHHRQPRQQNLHYNTHFPNHRQQPYRQILNQPSQIPQDQLIYMIRTILWEENSYQYHTQM